MNSKILQDKVQEIEDEAIEMRLLKRSEKSQDYVGNKEKAVSTSQLTVSLKHYDQVSRCNQQAKSILIISLAHL